MSTKRNSSLSNLERAYNFRDVAFRQYMKSRSRHLLPPAILTELGDRMAQHEHPLVRYAAGWSAIELALFRGKTSSHTTAFPLENRLKEVDKARERWLSAGRGMQALCEAQTTAKKQWDVRSIEYRLIQALAYIPAMEVAVATVAGKPFSPESTLEKLRKTQSSAAQLGRLVTRMKPQKNKDSQTNMMQIRLGLASEIACGLVAQSDDPRTYLYMPASFRQDNNVMPPLRADFLAIHTRSPYKRTLIQVKSAETQAHSPKAARPNSLAASDRPALMVIAERDLVLGPDLTVYNTLNTFHDIATGAATDEMQLRARVLGRVLAMRINAH